jgi:hypothetical protein
MADAGSRRWRTRVHDVRNFEAMAFWRWLWPADTKPQDSAFCFLSGPVYRRRNSWHLVPGSFSSLSSTLICVNFLASPHSPDVRSFFRSPGILSSHYNNFATCIEASDSRELCFEQLVPRIIILYLSIFWLPRSLRKCVFFCSPEFDRLITATCELHRVFFTPENFSLYNLFLVL